MWCKLKSKTTLITLTTFSETFFVLLPQKLTILRSSVGSPPMLCYNIGEGPTASVVAKWRRRGGLFREVTLIYDKDTQVNKQT